VICVGVYSTKRKSLTIFGWKTFKKLISYKYFELKVFHFLYFILLSYKVTILHFIGLSIYSGLDFFFKQKIVFRILWIFMIISVFHYFYDIFKLFMTTISNFWRLSLSIYFDVNVPCSMYKKCLPMKNLDVKKSSKECIKPYHYTRLTYNNMYIFIQNDNYVCNFSSAS